MGFESVSSPHGPLLSLIPLPQRPRLTTICEDKCLSQMMCGTGGVVGRAGRLGLWQTLQEAGLESGQSISQQHLREAQVTWDRMLLSVNTLFITARKREAHGYLGSLGPQPHSYRPPAKITRTPYPISPWLFLSSLPSSSLHLDVCLHNRPSLPSFPEGLGFQSCTVLPASVTLAQPLALCTDISLSHS